MTARKDKLERVPADPGKTDGSLTDEIARASSFVRWQKQRVRARLRPYLDDYEPISNGALEEITAVLEELSVRISTMEECLEQFEVGRGRGVFAGLRDELDISCEEMPGAVLHPMETDAKGRNIRWTKTEEFEIALPLFRCVPKVLRFHFSAIIKTEYMRSLIVLVDDKPVRHKVKRTKEGFFLQCIIPAGGALGATNVVLRLPTVHAPSEVTNSSDQRTMGIALHRLVVMNRPSSFLKRLRSGTVGAG